MPEYRVKPGGMHHRFLNCRKKVQVIGGGFGNGKTAASVIKAIQLCKDYPGCKGIIAMATYAQLNDTIREEFYKWVPASAVKRWPTIADNTLIFKNGSQVNFRYIKQKGKAAAADGNTSSNLLSATYDFAVVDQIENPEITYKDYLDLFGRLRGSTEYKGVDPTMPSTGPRWMILTANPSFNWVFHKIIKPWEHFKKTGEYHPDLLVDPETGDPMIEIFEAPTYENKHNLAPDFIKGLEAAYTGQFRDRYLGGEWGAFEGLVYPMFNSEFHMIHKERIMNYIIDLCHKGLKPQFIEGFDHGIASPACYLCGFIDHVGRIFIVDGFYSKELELQEIAAKIISLRMQYGPFAEDVTTVLADPSIFKRTVVQKIGTAATTVAKMFLEQYNINMTPAQNAIIPGITKIASYLGVKNFPHFETGELNGALIYFSSHLSFMSDEFLSYFWAMSSHMERIDQPIDRNDHSMDTLKYMLSYIPAVTKLLVSYTHTQQGAEQWLKRQQEKLSHQR